jgi:hypothetical protein
MNMKMKLKYVNTKIKIKAFNDYSCNYGAIHLMDIYFYNSMYFLLTLPMYFLQKTRDINAFNKGAAGMKGRNRKPGVLGAQDYVPTLQVSVVWGVSPAESGGPNQMC